MIALNDLQLKPLRTPAAGMPRYHPYPMATLTLTDWPADHQAVARRCGGRPLRARHVPPTACGSRRHSRAHTRLLHTRLPLWLCLWAWRATVTQNAAGASVATQ